MPFRAISADKTEAGQDVRFVEMDESELMEGDVTVRVTHSTVNYKDGLALSGKSAIIRRFPMVLGIDLAGVVETSAEQDFANRRGSDPERLSASARRISAAMPKRRG